MNKKPNCYKCKHRGSIPGDAHSCCNHPAAEKDKNPFGEVMAIFASVGRTAPMSIPACKELNIRGNKHGIEKGWFNWPYNFDPVWLENCDGFENDILDKGSCNEKT